MDRAIDFLTKNIKDSTVVLAISGGPDSMALLHLLNTMINSLNIKIICAHVNHNVREESDDEQKDIYNYCIKNNIIFEFIKIDKWSNDNFEQEARNVRYNFFEEMIKKYKANFLLTAHHGDDLIETILMRIVRGSSLKGYAGFEQIVQKNNYKILRPFITLTKKDLVNYCESNNIKYAIDKTNLDNSHTRNRYRNTVLPFLKEEDVNVQLKFNEFSTTLLECNKYISKVSEIEQNRIYMNNILDIYEFNKLEKIIKVNIISNILQSIYNDKITKINKLNVDLILNLTSSNKSNIKVDLPDDYIAIKTYNTLRIIKKQDNDNYNIKLLNKVLLPNNKYIEIIFDTTNNSNFFIKLDSKEIKLPLYVRNKKNGDKIKVKNLNGSKKIKDILIDCKIPIDKRKTWPIVVDSNDTVLWIPGLKKSEYSKKENYDIVLEYKD